MTECVVITGLSGAGRSTAADVFEDRGWFVIDNLPVALMPRVTDIEVQPKAQLDRVAFVMGSGPDPDELVAMVEQLRADGWWVRMLFLDSRDDVLIRRFESTRRRHPSGADDLLGEAIEQERARFEPLRAAADVVIDTSDLNVHELRDRVSEVFPEGERDAGMQVAVMSFGFKHGVPADVDMVLDCRFLPNPHWVEELRPQSGRDAPVRDHVLASEMTGPFLERLDDLFEVLLPAFEAEGKAYLTVAYGCTGGRHRSVAIAEEMGRRLVERGYTARVTHRDLEKHP